MNPLSEDEMCHKFMANSKGILGQERAEKLWDALLNLEKTPKISTLAPSLAKAH